MGYENQLARKTSHSDLVKNPDITAFLGDCSWFDVPSEEQGKEYAKNFVAPPAGATGQPIMLPADVIAIDGSPHEAPMNPTQLPSTRVGYVKIGALMIQVSDYDAVRDGATGLVDPMRLARLRQNGNALSYCLPGANVRYAGRKSVREGFRLAMDQQLRAENSWTRKGDPWSGLMGTLYEVAYRRLDRSLVVDKDPTTLVLQKCPSCGEESSKGKQIKVPFASSKSVCPFCGEEVFAADCLRIYEEVGDAASLANALNRFMSVVERLMIVHFLRDAKDAPEMLEHGLAIFVDGPMAVFGNCAWVHAGILAMLHEINDLLRAHKQPPVLVVGQQKGGALVEHFQVLSRFIPNDSIFPVTDDYRYTYVSPNDEYDPTDTKKLGFGAETYFGQDFVYKTPEGRLFVIAVPYPIPVKEKFPPGWGKHFKDGKVEMGRYSDLPTDLALVRHFETELYTSGVSPIALAHEHTAISLMPGGKVLNLMSAKHFGAVAPPAGGTAVISP